MIDLGASLVAVLDTAEGLLTRSVARKFVSHGPPPFDCADQLTVHLDSIKASNPLTRQDIGPNRCAVVPVAPIVFTIVRCVTVQQGRHSVPPETLTADASALLLDLNELWNGLVAATLDGTLIEGVGCSAFTWLPATSVGPSGGFAAWQLKVEVQVA